LRAWCIVPAAGSGRRMGGTTKKQFLDLAGRPLLLHALEALAGWEGCTGIVAVAPPGEVDRVAALVEGLPARVTVVPGGEERQDSVRLGLEVLERAGASPGELVLVHDGVRPFPPVHRLEELCRAARPEGALLALPCGDTLKREEAGSSLRTLDREGVWRAQTPQAFPLSLLRHALDRARQTGFRGTDEASLVEAAGGRPRLVLGDPANVKVTTPEDLAMAERLCAGAPTRLHVGHGYDVHRLVEGRPLILGGVEVPHDRGLLGHSDADVLAHAIGDACLGAAGFGDLGRHFPDADPTWKGISSLTLLQEIAKLLRGRGFRIVRVDATLAAEKPKVAPYVPRMEENLTRALALALGPEPESRAVTIKATTTEGLGFEGRMEGMSAHAVALLEKRD
jgi:2-C-methyl-D-erythritol 4-phosphate cytidylyltransferase / 2-C-methyl-D-erythritol 2,4-cyclodiphosphate synthase